MERKTYDRRIRCLAVLSVVVTMAVSTAVFLVTQSLSALFLVLGGCLVLCLFSFLLRRLDDRYVSGVVVKLSLLMDVLMQLEEREIFPENEDTIVSKLQNQVVRLVRILKNKNEKTRQEQEEMKQIVSDISHQLKTPLSNLKMYSEFIQEESLTDEKRREYIEVIGISVESGLIQLKLQKQSLGETVLRALKDAYPKAKQKDIEIEYHEEGAVILPHDANWTAEAVYNLLDNAVKYAGAGTRIVLSVRMLGLFAEVSVEDENEAIPEAEQSKIFMRFFRGSNSRGEQGLGIGLYLTREIAVRQGGHIRLKTTERGNTFSLLLYAGRT